MTYKADTVFRLYYINFKQASDREMLTETLKMDILLFYELIISCQKLYKKNKMLIQKKTEHWSYDEPIHVKILYPL